MYIMLWLLNYFDDFSKAQGLNQWRKDSTTTAVIAENEGFQRYCG